MKIITLNLAGYMQWEDRKRSVVSFIGKEEPDIIFLQEVKFDPTIEPISQSTWINQQLANPYQYEQTSITRFHQPKSDDAYREGLAVLSRFPITQSEALVLIKNEADEHTRIVQNVDVQVHEKLMKFTNVHFSNNRYSDDQFHELLTILERRNEKRIIIGDFNMYDLSLHKSSYDKKYTASIEYANYISFPNENITLDYILLPHELEYGSLTVVSGLSDHAALVAEINSKQPL